MSRPYYLKLLSPGISNPVKLHTFTCERCGKKFDLPFWYLKKGRRFCSHACRMEDPLKKLMRMHIKRDDGCWDYTGFTDMGGYGQIKVGKRMWNTHRLMWTLWNKKKIPDGMVVRHTCIGNRKCINPDHLLIGTSWDNVHDMLRQGRFVGRRPDTRMFSNDQVREIRRIRSEQGLSYRKLSKMFNVGGGPIWQIINGKSYKDIK